ncbi:MAG: DUF308 domain-containing protein [Erysipelotrichaceae bacterium]|nr:DUF308 domain-containing protein [Erysipelotrichaceae bacterium]
MKILKENKTLAILTLIELICGILVLIDVIAFTKTILRIIGILVTIRGALFAMDYFKKSPETASLGNDLFMSLITIGIGIFFILNPDKIIDTFSLLTSLYGIGLFISAASKIQLAVDELRLKNNKWWYFAILAALTLIVAYVSFMNPFTTVSSNWTFTGIAMIVLALFDVATVVFKYVDIKPKPKVAPETPTVEPIDAQITVKEVIEEPEEIKEVSVEDIIADEKAVMEENPAVEEPAIEEIKDEDTKVE